MSTSKETNYPQNVPLDRLQAARKGEWKAHFIYYDHSLGGYSVPEHWVKPETPLLYDFEADPSEQYDLAGRHPDIVADLTAVFRDYEREIQQNRENRELYDRFANKWADVTP